jgi:hypothetical protein
MGNRRITNRILVGTFDGKSHLEDLDVDGITLNCILKKWDREAWTGLLWLRIRTAGGCL